jgi:hypothetical protein
MRCLTLVLVLVPVAARAQVYNDGGLHVLSGPADMVQIYSGTAVTLVDPASVTHGVTVDLTSSLMIQGGERSGSQCILGYSRSGHYVPGIILGLGGNGHGRDLRW